MNEFSILSLGDSYTIGEGVPLYQCFPYQVVQMLRKEGFIFHAPEIVAKTGWTTSELIHHLYQTMLQQHYDFVTLLMGVNNQYRGLSEDDYKVDFTTLLNRAIKLAGKAERVIVLSIPDWGATPFAEGRDKEKIAVEINSFNLVSRQLSHQSGSSYIDVTNSSREVGENSDYLTNDKLHYSGREYQKWAQLVAEVIKTELAKGPGRKS
jgi:lysophospholipase L1-like esterase